MFESVWSLQSFLLSEADRCDVPIITNNDKEKVTQQIIQHVVQELSKQFKSQPNEVFGASVVEIMKSDQDQPWYELLAQLRT